MSALVLVDVSQQIEETVFSPSNRILSKKNVMHSCDYGKHRHNCNYNP